MSIAEQNPALAAEALEPVAGERVVVAMSGGVDSSVAAVLLAERGLDVVGISMRLAPESKPGVSSGCCSLEDFRDAGRVAARIGVPHYVFDLREEFERDVVRPFVEEYLRGRTPSPCILCNREIKFRVLHRKAAELGARYVATGHYARRVRRGGAWRLLRARFEDKDQSYFLFELGQAELARTLFPVGDMRKEEVRRAAERLGLDVARKPESQEICFVPDGRYAEFVERVAGDKTRSGAILDACGREIGRHAGVHRFTVGQRRGLGVAAPEPLYVKGIDSERASVTVVPRPRLAASGFLAAGSSWVLGRPLADGTVLDVRIRHRHRPVPATIRNLGPDTVRVDFLDPQDSVSPGQAAVFYHGDEVVGGAWISASIDAPERGACA
jgi:tRNA-specific 2-thiouridylase